MKHEGQKATQAPRATGTRVVAVAFLTAFAGGAILAPAQQAEAAHRYDHAFYCQIWNGPIYEGGIVSYDGAYAWCPFRWGDSMVLDDITYLGVT